MSVIGRERAADGKQLLATGINAILVPESDAGGSAIVFLRDRGLFAQRFDEQRLELRGAGVRWQTASARSSTTASSQRRQASLSTASPTRSTS